MFAELDSVNASDSWKLDMTSREVTPFRRTPAGEANPALSPDGRWLAYISAEIGRTPEGYRRPDVLVEPFPGGGARLQLSSGGGTEPLWAQDGRHLYDRNGSRLISVAIDAGTTLSASAPALLFEGRFKESPAIGPAVYAVAPDGRSFYFVRTAEQPPSPQRINVVLGWLDEFQKRRARP